MDKGIQGRRPLQWRSLLLALLLAGLPLAATTAAALAAAAAEPPAAAAGSPAPAPVPEEVRSWFAEARQAHYRGAKAEALRLQARVIEWLRSHLLEPHPFRASALLAMGVFHAQLEQWQEASDWMAQSSEIWRRLDQRDPGRYLGELANSLKNQGRVLNEQSRWQEALEQTAQAAALYRRLLRSDPGANRQRALANTVNDLGLYLGDVGRWQEALTLAREAVAIRTDLARQASATRAGDGERDAESLRAEDLYELAGAQLNLGRAYRELGQRQEALAPGLAAVTTAEQLVALRTTPAHRTTLALALTNLGQTQSALGRLQEAQASSERALALWLELDKIQAASQKDLATAWDSALSLLDQQSRWQEALPIAQALIDKYRIAAKTNDFFQGTLAETLTKKARFLVSLQQPQQALPLFEEAVLLLRQLVSSNASYLGFLAPTLNNLGALYATLGRPQQALAATEESVQIRRRLAATNSFYTEGLAKSLLNLADLHRQQGNDNAALPLLRELVSREILYLQAQLPLLPEGRRQALVATFGSRWQVPFSLAPGGPDGAELALFTRLNRQGLLQDIQRSQVLLSRAGPQRGLAEQLAAVSTLLASTTLAPTQRQRLQAQREQLELDLYRQLPALRPQLVEPRVLQRRLPPAGALLEFQRYWRYDPQRPADRRWQSPHYLALVLRPEGPIQAVALGEASVIEAAVAAALQATASNLSDAPELWAQVSRLVISPLRGSLAGVQELFLSPDGELNRVPFTALPDPASPGRLWGERQRLRLLTSGRDLLRLQQPPLRGGPSVVMANPLYDGPAALGGPRPAVAGLQRQKRSAAFLGVRLWPSLPATAVEAKQVAPLLHVRQPMTGAQATAALALRQRAPLVFHIAAHGFFDPEPPQRQLQAPRQQDDGAAASAVVVPEDPLLRSGLALAGANHPERDPADDGYLTAAEVVGMDLQGTELVTLSACETGLGDVRSGEGVYGLQRALTVAGARSTLLSLWKVDDGATAAFMTEFYGRLRRGEGRGDALIHTQAAFRRHANPLYRDLAVWGAFQLSGDWRPIPALR